MTQKVCQLYEEEQVGKVGEGRKAVPTNKMPDLGWDIAKTQIQEDWKSAKAQEKSENNTPHITSTLQSLIAVTIIITTILEHVAVYVKEVPNIAKKTVQAVKSTTMKAVHNKLLQNIKDSYKRAALAITIVTSTKDCTNHTKQPHVTNRKAQIPPITRKLNDKYDGSYQSHTSRTYNNNGN